MNESIQRHNQKVQHLLDEYNDNINEKPDRKETHAEMFDTRPISNMKNMDNIESYRKLILKENWKTYWSKEGVQVPLKKEEEQNKAIVTRNVFDFSRRTFEMPQKLIRSTSKHLFDENRHVRVKEQDRQFLYELDMLDENWLSLTNQERQCLGLVLVKSRMMEAVFEMVEKLCFRRIQKKVREEESNFVEHDVNSKCDVCQSTESEEENELVICEGCFVCVHQACYGIGKLPKGQWICRYCEVNESDTNTAVCALCPNRGGALKPFDHDPDKWGHLSCTVWIPEVGFGNVERMEPIVRFNSIPPSRWQLRCSLCKQFNVGAPIQCTKGKCAQAFHVTCGFKYNLYMVQLLQENEIKLIAYCKTHSKELDHDPDKITPQHTDIKEFRVKKWKEFERKFYELVNLSEINNCIIDHPEHLIGQVRNIPKDILEKIFTYWKLKRTSRHYQFLIEPPQSWTQEVQANRVSKRTALFMFCKLRFGLDRARLIIDQIQRREKKKAQLFNNMCDISHIQLDQLRRSLDNPILVDDPSLAANWGFVSTAHLDNNVYTNPDKLKDPNLEVILLKRKSTKLKRPIKKSSLTAVAATTPLPPPPPAAITKTMKKEEIIKRKEIIKEFNVNDIPEEKLIIPDTTKSILTATLKDPIFYCSYIVNECNERYQNELKEENIINDGKENILILDVPEESDSSNQSLNQSNLDLSSSTCATTARIPRKRKLSRNIQNTRNLFEDFLFPDIKK